MTNKLKYFIGNWKMFGDINSFKIINKINQFSIKSKKQKKKIIICVTKTLINFFKKKLKSKFISLGAQNCHHLQKYGPHTGSVSASMLKKVGAEFVILGHSENRMEGDSPKLIKKKVSSALSENLNVIFCIGETANEKKQGKTFSVLSSQIQNSIEKNFNLNKIIIAYEPVWSIGTGDTPKFDDLLRITAYIKAFFKKKFKTKKLPKVLYGGSVNDKNIIKFSALSIYMDGFLIGGASQSSKKFIDIIINYYK